MSTKPRNSLTGTSRNWTAGLPITKVSTTDGWGDKVRAEVTAETAADAEAALDTRRKGAVDPQRADREQLKAAQDKLQTLMDKGLDGWPGR